MISTILDSLQQFLLPAFCEDCRAPLRRQEIICCSMCLNRWPRQQETLLTNPSTGLKLCVNSLMAYRGTSETLIRHCKRFPANRLLLQLSKISRGQKSDSRRIFCPVPLAPEIQRERGHNQALMIARSLQHADDLLLNLLRCPSARKSRKQQGRRERLSQLRGIGLKDNLARQRIREIRDQRLPLWLVDDVLTTGSTLLECAAVLKRADLRVAGALVLARTPDVFEQALPFFH